jgi:hypothetical protein
VHQEQAADPLALLLRRVHDRGAGLNLARVHAQERQLSNERIVQDLERERGERRVVARLTRLDLVRVGVLALDRWDVHR